MARKRRDRTAEVLAEMLVEDTGRSMLDSGGTPRYDSNGNYVGSQYGYGRSFERNRGREFGKEPATVLSFRYGDIEVTHNLYHWLRERVEYDWRMQARFTRFATSEDHEDHSWFKCVEEFPAYLKSKGHEIGGLYGAGSDPPITDNSYNSDNFLSQDIQFTLFYVDGEGYIALMVHGGCDARGGYTAPRFFRCDENIFNYGDAYIRCEGRQLAPEEQLDLPGMKRPNRWDLEHSWSYSGGWSKEGNYWGGDWKGKEVDLAIDKYEIKRVGWDDDEEELAPGQGYIYVDDDGVGYCPIDGSRLMASW